MLTSSYGLYGQQVGLLMFFCIIERFYFMSADVVIFRPWFGTI